MIIPLNVVGIHGVGGILGMLVVGLFAAHGHRAVQLTLVVSADVYSSPGSHTILKWIDRAMGLPVRPQEEATGLDTMQHSEGAYS